MEHKRRWAAVRLNRNSLGGSGNGFAWASTETDCHQASRGQSRKAKLNEAVPTLTVGVPECPGYLDDVAKKEWGRLTVILTAMKVLAEADYFALVNLCQAYSTLMNAQKQMNNSGILYKTRSAYIQQSPLLGIIHTQTNIVNNLLRDFGLTASSRTRVAMAEPKDKPPNRFATLDVAEEDYIAADPQMD